MGGTITLSEREKHAYLACNMLDQNARQSVGVYSIKGLHANKISRFKMLTSSLIDV